ncbi:MULTISPECIES: hypothetical protein [unclassified Pseudoxanthomonas]|jgi:hypothetical protein|uniref:hypothetical protein n=1 Tax=unclassified Pseudoxanthomonas TaxID=2645906 RepID=UPI001621F4D7|nr:MULTISPECIES: hypothetical protein [unclassified Pseudoxanthomonas]MBB3277891.1 hypothetical protein [Pseudoxanthomonas sp. OG2]MBV7474562.1 hypothetical protein [Pseudoxanthomonas sp. PXM05]UBB25889.1 hypothetical protein LAG73_02010 [Pseudoxanthomonas japonensis]
MKMISRMVLRMYAPAVVIAAGGFVVAETVARTQTTFSGFSSGRTASLSFLAAIVLGTAWALHSSWRLYRWALGRERRCGCGGLMSRPRLNRRGEIYRKCIGCGGKTVIRHVH